MSEGPRGLIDLLNAPVDETVIETKQFGERDERQEKAVQSHKNG